MTGLSQSRFELQGEFAGYVRTQAGKRRMVLRSGSDEWRLKVPKQLRRQLDSHLTPGHRIAVTGVEQIDEWTGTVRRVVSQVQLLMAPAPPALPAPCATCTIRVCSKKTCWKAGGKDLWDALQQQIDARGLAGTVKLKAVGCLGNCKRAPNAVAADRYHERCDARAAAAILNKAIAASPSRSAGG